jgi:hypothetical protein
MPYDYTDDQLTAIELIEEFGENLKLENPDGDTTKAVGVFLALGKDDLPNTNTQVQVMNVFIEPSKKVLKRAPRPGDYLSRDRGNDEVVWSVMEVEEIRPGDLIILYKVRVSV